MMYNLLLEEAISLYITIVKVKEQKNLIEIYSLIL